MDRMIRLDDEADRALEDVKHEVLVKTGKRLFKKQIVNWIVLNVFTCRDNSCQQKFYKWVETL